MSDIPSDDIAIVKGFAQQLGEHFDTVQIFVTRHEPATLDGTVTVQYGTGNWYARFGHVSEWIVKQNEFSRMKCHQEMAEDGE